MPVDPRLDALVQHRIGLERYQTSVLRQVIPVLEQAEQDLVSIINTKLFAAGMPPRSELRRLEVALNTVRRAQLESYNVIFKRLWSEFRGLAGHEGDWANNYYRDLFGVTTSLEVPSASMLVAAALERPMSGRTLKAWADKMKAEHIADVEQQIRLGVIEGESVDQIVRRLRGTEAFKGRDGIFMKRRNSAEALVRTSINHIANAAHASFLRGNPKVFKRYQWVSVLDRRTTPVCRSRSGQIYVMGEGPLPPAHPRCRSTILGLPSGPDGKLLAEPLEDIGYDEWLRDQPQEVIQDVLGIEKAKLFSLGKLPIENFVDHSGKELTLADLRRTERDAWERAFLRPEDRSALSVTRRLNSLVARASDDIRPYAETAQRAWDFLRYGSNKWVEATAMFRKPIDPDLIFAFFALDFFVGPPIVSLGRAPWYWRQAVRRAIRGERAALTYPHTRMPRGLHVHPEVRPRHHIDGDILPPTPRSRMPVPIGPKPRPGSGVIIDIDPSRPPPVGPRPVLPPRTPDSIIVPPKAPPAPRPPVGPPPATPPGTRPPTPVEKLPGVFRVQPEKGAETIIPKIVDEVKGPTPPSPVKLLPAPDRPVQVPALTQDLKPPQNPLRVTVPELEKQLDRLLPQEGSRADADKALRDLWEAFKKRGHDGLEIFDEAGKVQFQLGIDEKRLGGLIERWRNARAQLALPAPEARPALPAPAVITERPALRPGAQPPAVIELPFRPPPLDIPASGVPADIAAVAKADLENAQRALDRLTGRLRDRGEEAVARLKARTVAEEATRRAMAQKQIRDLLAELNQLNAGLEGTAVISKAQAARADMLQRIILQNKVLFGDVTLLKPMRWGEFAERLGDSPARLVGTILETPAFTSATTDELVAFRSATKGRGPLVVFRTKLKAGDSLLRGNADLSEVILPAGSRFKITASTRMKTSEVPAELRRLYPKDQEFWLAETELVRPGDAAERAITAARASQEPYIREFARTPLDNEAEQALRHTPLAPVRQIGEQVGTWPQFRASSNDIAIGRPRAVELEPPARPSVGIKERPFSRLSADERRRQREVQRTQRALEEKPADPKQPDAAPKFRRALGEMINRSGRKQPLSNIISDDLKVIGDRIASNKIATADSRLLDKGQISDVAAKVVDRRVALGKLNDLEIPTPMFGMSPPGSVEVLGDAINRRDLAMLGRISSELAHHDFTAYFMRSPFGGVQPTEAAKHSAEVAHGFRMLSELIHALSRGKVSYPHPDGPVSYLGKESASHAFRAWFALQYSPNPMFRRIIAETMPDLDETMRQVLRARAREPFPDVWAPTLRMLPNRRIVADPRALVPRTAPEVGTATQVPGIRESTRQRFYDHLEGGGSLSAREQSRLAKELGVSKADVEVLMREAQRAGWIRAHGRGFTVVDEAQRPPRPVGLPVSAPTGAQRASFYDYLEGRTGSAKDKLGSLSQAALRDLAKDLGATPLQMNRLTLEAQEFGWLTRDGRGQLRRTWTKGLEKGKTPAPARPTPQDIERSQGTLGTPATRIDPAEMPRRRRSDDDDTSGGAGGGLVPGGGPGGPVGPSGSEAAAHALIHRNEIFEVVQHIAGDLRNIPIDKLAHTRLPVRSASEQVLVNEIWRNATVSPDIETAIIGSEQPILSNRGDGGPMYYDPVTGVMHQGGLDPAKPENRVWYRHEYAHHLDLPMTPDGTVVQYSAAPQFGFSKAMSDDVAALAKAYKPEAPLHLTAGEAVTQFQSAFGINLSGISDERVAHQIAEYALTGNPAFLKVVDQAVRGGLITDPKLAGEFTVYSDLTAAVTQLKLGTGHPQHYYDGGFDLGHGYTSRHANEAFANWFALYSSDSPGWRALMRRYFPQASNSAGRILEQIGKDANGE
jgi:SPP1 gp7 family putative phage head morphogenesis protein